MEKSREQAAKLLISLLEGEMAGRPEGVVSHGALAFSF
jgi:hypothetical protein